MPRLSAENVERARATIALYPQPRSAMIPLLHLVQEQDGYLTKDGMEHVAELLGLTPVEVYVSIESPRGELGCYLVSDGSARPYRMHIRAPSFVNLQTLPHLMRGGLVADAVAIISSVDPIMGEVDR